ncbi:MAG: response regulator [Candidatus Caenarcaniphilales bacterium]|nr:response regulator [Candidatus Caenarcaniphilales bacterium]
MCSANILLIEDNVADVELTKRTFREVGIDLKLNVAFDADAGLSFLNSIDDLENHGPSLILLDLNLPKKNGLELLQELKANTKFAYIPVIILSCSQNPEDIREAYKSLASAYLHKSIDRKEYIETVREFKNYWLDTVALSNKQPLGDC